MKRMALALLTVALLATAVYGYALKKHLTYWADEYKEELISCSVVHVVQRGETLWGLARLYHPREDPRSVVSYVRWINDLEGPKGPILRPGQPVLIPREFK